MSKRTRQPPEAAGDSQRLDPAEAVLRILLERHPTADVLAIDGQSSAARVPLPPFIPQQSEGVVPDGPLREAVVPADRALVAKLWAQARAQGVAVAVVRLQRDPERPGSLCMFDLRAGHGVMVVAFLESRTAGLSLLEEAGLEVHPVQPSRVARASKDPGAVLRWTEPALSEMLGWDQHELIGRRTLEFVHPDDQEPGVAHWMEMLESPGPGRRVRLRHRHRDGSWVWLEVTNHNRLSDPQHADVLTEMVDVSEEMAAHEALRAREQLLAQLTETVPMGLFHADLRGNLLFANRRLQAITGITSATTLVEQLAALGAEDRSGLDEALRSAAAGAETEVEIDLRSESGDARHCTLSVRPLTDDMGTVTGLTGCLEDVTDMTRSRRELEAKAESDPLTGCLNRHATVSVLQGLLHGSAVPPSDPAGGTAVIFVDLDGLKPINDSLGHAAGDELLVKVATRLRASIRSGDVVGRFGGDEFVVVCRDVPGSAAALGIARSLSRKAFRPVKLAGAGSVPVRASTGVAWTAGEDVPADHLIQAADEAMYQSKRAGRCEPVLAPAPDL